MSQTTDPPRWRRRARRVVLVVVSLSVSVALLFVFNGLILAAGETPVSGRTRYAPAAPFKTPGVVRLKILSYNIAKAYAYKGGGRFDSAAAVRSRLETIASIINQEQPDLVVLSEVMTESGPCRVNQVVELARLTGMHSWVFGENYNFGLPFFRAVGGNAILSRRPLEPVANHSLAGRRPFYLTQNSRRVLWCRVKIGPADVLIASIHNDSFDLQNNTKQVVQELKFLEGEQWQDAFLVGDFNALAGQRPIRLIQNSGHFTGKFDGPATFPSWRPDRCIDFIFAPKTWTLLEHRVLPGTVSDHRAVVAVFQGRR